MNNNKKERKEYDKKYREKKKEKIKEPVKCNKCGIYIQKNCLKNHQSRMICKKFWDYSLLETDDEE